jgi:predicted enzyme related to lactoylglutathione lyase
MKDYDNFFLPVRNLEQGKQFYAEILGLKIKFDFPSLGMAAFKVGRQEPAVILSSRPNSKPAIWFRVDDVQEMFGKLKPKGVEFLAQPFVIKTGVAAEFEDPFGNRLGITDYSTKTHTSSE